MATMLTTATGLQVPKLVLRPSMLLDRTTVLYGSSKTGKTVIVKNIMKLLNDHIEQILIISPTEAANQAFRGFVDPTLIHYRMHLPDPACKKDTDNKAALRFLETMYRRQEMMAAIYVRANALEVLASLYARLPKAEQAEGGRSVASLERKRRRVVHSLQSQYAHDPGMGDEKVREVNDKFEKMLALIYKKYITPGVERLWALKASLSEDELYSLNYLHFNPRLLLIFDDCAAQLKPMFKQEVFRKLFYQNRHSFITMIVCCQDDTDLAANLRKNVFVSIFTEKIVCTTNFDRAANGHPKKTKRYVADIVDDVYVGHRKLAYIRDDDAHQHFYHLTCSYPRPFLFGSAALEELCADVRSAGGAMDTDNPFYEKFRV